MNRWIEAYLTAEQGRKIYDHIQHNGVERVLEIGTAHGVGAAYMAATGAHVTTVDHVNARYDPQPDKVLSRAGVLDSVTLVRREDANYNWWLKDQIRAGATYDFCFLDGSHNFTIDGMAVVLIEQLLVNGAWLLMDDLDWNPGVNPDAVFDPDNPHSTSLLYSAAERSEAHMRSVFDYVVKPHSAFAEMVEDRDWAWARKDPGGAKSLEVRHRPALKRVVNSVAARLRG